MFIKETIDTLKSQLENNKLRLIAPQGEIQTVGFSFNPPIENKRIQEIEEKYNWYIPKDYRTFLLQHNGAKLYQLYLGETNIGGGLLLYSLEEALTVQQRLSMNNDYYPIGYVHEHHLMVKNTKYDNKNYLYIRYTDKEPLNMNFELFLDRFIVSNGSNFWEWPRLDAEKYYYYF